MISDCPYTDERIMAVLDNRTGHEWHAHGIGMLRTYLDEEREWRLNLWHSCLLNPGISTMHDHPWPFTSYIFAGEIENTRFRRSHKKSVGAFLMNEGKIECGPGYAGMKPNPIIVPMIRDKPELFRRGQTYTQHPDEIHDTKCLDGTITVIRRGPSRSGCEASVFWPIGQTWGDATRQFDAGDADRTIDACRFRLEREMRA